MKQQNQLFDYGMNFHFWLLALSNLINICINKEIIIKGLIHRQCHLKVVLKSPRLQILVFGVPRACFYSTIKQLYLCIKKFVFKIFFPSHSSPPPALLCPFVNSPGVHTAEPQEPVDSARLLKKRCIPATGLSSSSNADSSTCAELQFYKVILRQNLSYLRQKSLK